MTLSQAKIKWPKQYETYKKECLDYRRKFPKAEIGEIYIYYDPLEDSGQQFGWGTETAFECLKSHKAKILETF